MSCVESTSRLACRMNFRASCKRSIIKLITAQPADLSKD